MTEDRRGRPGTDRWQEPERRLEGVSGRALRWGSRKMPTVWLVSVSMATMKNTSTCYEGRDIVSYPGNGGGGSGKCQI